MLEDGTVRLEECICEPCSDIMPNWKDIRAEFGYTKVIRNREQKVYDVKNIWKQNK
jgi:hypothetical protein